MTKPSARFDTAVVATGEREQLVRDVVSSGMLPVDVTNLRAADAGIDLTFTAAALGPLAIQSMALSPTIATRGARLARDDSPRSLFLQVKQSGLSLLEQEGREAEFGPDELVLVSSGQPSVVVNHQLSQRRVLQIPWEHLALPDAALRRATAVPVGRDLPLAGVLARLVEGFDLAAAATPAEQEHLARATVELVRGLVVMVDGEDPWRRTTDSTLALHIVDYLDRHWREPDLTAERLAAVHHVSTRQLYRLLAAEGITLHDWLRRRRLEACREELARPTAVGLSVSAVGRRWGFPDATNFGRAFKSAFGLTPTQWRSLHRPG